MTSNYLTALAITGLAIASASAASINFDTITLPSQGYWIGADNTVNPTIGGVNFHNNYDPGFGSWSGFAFSNRTNNTDPSFTNQYSVFTGAAASGSNFAVGYYSSYDTVSTQINLGSLTNLSGLGMSVGNTTYTALSMTNGDPFAKKFGGTSGNDADFFKLIITGSAAGSSTGSIEFFLADFRFADNSLDYILSQWATVDLSALGSVDTLNFTFESSDVGPFGINTPTYFATDNFLTAVPEPSSMLLSFVGLAFLARRKR